eukprot:226098-Hanusia_phi.AAC.1
MFDLGSSAGLELRPRTRSPGPEALSPTPSDHPIGPPPDRVGILRLYGTFINLLFPTRPLMICVRTPGSAHGDSGFLNPIRSRRCHDDPPSQAPTEASWAGSESPARTDGARFNNQAPHPVRGPLHR